MLETFLVLGTAYFAVNLYRSTKSSVKAAAQTARRYHRVAQTLSKSAK